MTPHSDRYVRVDCGEPRVSWPVRVVPRVEFTTSIVWQNDCHRRGGIRLCKLGLQQPLGQQDKTAHSYINLPGFQLLNHRFGSKRNELQPYLQSCGQPVHQFHVQAHQVLLPIEEGIGQVVGVIADAQYLSRFDSLERGALEWWLVRNVIAR